MAADMDFTPPCEIVEDGYGKDNVSDMESENLDNVKRVSLGKPPRHLSVMCHSMGSAKLIAEANLELDIGIVVHKSSSDEKNEFLPILRSGNCAEMGPKQYMEDEHICVDDLIGHLGTTAEVPSPGAFYGCIPFKKEMEIYIFYPGQKEGVKEKKKEKRRNHGQ